MKRFLFFKISFLSSFGNPAISIFNILFWGIIISGSLSAQTLKAKQENAKSNSSEKKMMGYPPHGYPCLGCAPCVPTTNPVEYCDINNAAKLTPHPDALAIGFVFTGGKMIPLATILAKADVVKKMAELGSVAKTVGKERQQKVKCACGTDIYGKDDAACGRICDFLKNYK